MATNTRETGMRLTAIALALAATTAQAGVTMKDPELFWRPYDQTEPRVLWVDDKMAVLDTGDITFGVGATINTNVLLPRAGHCVGYMIVRFNGYPMLVPVHELYPGDTPPKQFDRGTPQGSITFTRRDC